MPNPLIQQRARIGATLALICLLSGLVAACGGSNSSVTITFWSWVPGMQQVVDTFNASHPDIKVNLQNVGGGPAEYTKLTTALRDQASPPDVAEIEYAFLPQYELNNSLVDLSAYGANDLKSNFVNWAWNLVSQGNKVYAIPEDSGPMGLIYRQDIFDEYHLATPTTWAQYAQEAYQLHQANPNIAMTSFVTSDSAWFLALARQAGSQPFKINGKNLTIHLDDPPALQVADYWQSLIQHGAVSTQPPDRTPEWYASLDNGTIASWVTAAWALTNLQSNISTSVGQWRVALLPQWTEDAQVSENWGGSTDAVMTQSKYPEQAYEFVKWLNTDQTSVTNLSEKLHLFPTQNSELSSSAFNTGNSFYGGQNANKVFAQSSEEVNISLFQGSPFETYVDIDLGNQLALAIQGDISFEQALHNTQNEVVTYARSQPGFRVNEN